MTLGFIFHSWQINIASFELEYLIFFKVSVTLHRWVNWNLKENDIAALVSTEE